MFTGLVEAMGAVTSVMAEGPGARLSIEPPRALAASVREGDSIAINGCCLTAVAAGPQWSFQAGPETLSRTSLGNLRPGDTVNLERSMAADGRLDGHFVLGHIDGTGRVAAVERAGDWVTMWFEVPERLSRQMVEKGSVAVDGVSLTVVAAREGSFSVALVPHTLAVTTLGQRGAGDLVNIETDILAKYVERLLARGPS